MDNGARPAVSIDSCGCKDSHDLNNNKHKRFASFTGQRVMTVEAVRRLRRPGPEVKPLGKTLAARVAGVKGRGRRGK